MKKILFLFLFIASIFLTSCSLFNNTKDVTSNLSSINVSPSTITTNTITPTFRPIITETSNLIPTTTTNLIPTTTKIDDEEKYYNDLFNLQNKINIDINISDEELKKINDDYMRNTYRMADKVTITITYIDNTSYVREIEEVGIRMKGNTSRTSFFDNKIYQNVHFKLSFDETFDDENEYSISERKIWANTFLRNERKARTVFGLDGLEIKFNRENDASYSRDIYASYVYKKYGVLAQNMNLGTINFMNQNMDSNVDTLYKIYEPVDKYFIHRNFNKGLDDGDLYKATYGTSSGMPTLNQKDSSAYGINNEIYKNQKKITYDLKTNKKKSNHSMINNFLNWINSNENDLANDLINYLDEDYFYTLMAIQYLTGDWDNFLYDSNNYYLYFNDLGIAYFIPYDMDRCFGIQAKDHDMVSLSPTNYYNLQGDNNKSNLLIKTIFKNNSIAQEKYLNKLKEIASDILNIDNFKDSVYDYIYDNYHNSYDISLGNKPENRNNAPESYFTQKIKLI